jgi:hypothetical protein
MISALSCCPVWLEDREIHLAALHAAVCRAVVALVAARLCFSLTLGRLQLCVAHGLDSIVDSVSASVAFASVSRRIAL